MELLLILGALVLLGGGRKPAGTSAAPNPTRLTPMDPGGSTGQGATFTTPVQTAVPSGGSTVQTAVPPADDTDLAPVRYAPAAGTVAPSTAPTLTAEQSQSAAPVEVPYHQLNGPLAPTPGLQTVPATARGALMGPAPLLPAATGNVTADIAAADAFWRSLGVVPIGSRRISDKGVLQIFDGTRWVEK